MSVVSADSQGSAEALPAGSRAQESLAPTTIPGMDEGELVRLAKERNSDAWTHIFESCSDLIYRYIRCRVPDEATAEDLTSAVFAGALKSIDSYNYRGLPLRAWLYRIARNVVVSHRRRVFNERKIAGPIDALSAATGLLSRFRGLDDVPAASSFTLASSANDSNMIDRLDLREALKRLGAAQREVVVLRFIVGLSSEETAAVMNKDVGAVYSLQARAVLSLRKQLRAE